MNAKRMTIVVTLMLTLALSAAAFAGDFGGRSGQMRGKFDGWIETLPEGKQDLARDMIQEQRDGMYETMMLTKARRAELLAVLAKTDADQTRVKELVSELADLHRARLEDEVAFRQEFLKKIGVILPEKRHGFGGYSADADSGQCGKGARGGMGRHAMRSGGRF